MDPLHQHRPARRLLVVMPSWLGDTVMATPTLRALRGLYPGAEIAALIRDHLQPLLEPCPWIDRIVPVMTRRPATTKGVQNADAGQRGIQLARRLAKEHFDTAVLLPNSFRSALLVRTAGIERRVGYDRDGRGFLLTDRLLPRRTPERFVPVPTHDYYLGIARYLGAVDPDPAMQLFTSAEDDEQAERLLARAGVDLLRSSLVLINPGANYGDAKIWFADRFAAVADRCVRELGVQVAVTGAPKERAIIDQVLAAAKEPIIDLPALGVDLGVLKSIIRRSRLMVTNDTGPRHIAAAFGVPVVTVFGPTDPAWTDTAYERERIVRVDVFCGPCQKKKCPLDHRCMKLVDPDMVFARVAELVRDPAWTGTTG